MIQGFAEPPIDKRNAPHFFCILPTWSSGTLGNHMGKRFKIIDIATNSKFSKVLVVDVDNNADERVLHLESTNGNVAKGVEMSPDYTEIMDGPGYVLEGIKPLCKWEKGDIVEEQFYPEELDNRV